MSMVESFGELRADYDAAKTTRFRKRLTGVSSLGSGADFHVRIEHDNMRMLELARYFDRNDPIIGQAVTRLINNVLQDGLKIAPDTGDPELDAELKARMIEWGQDPDSCDAAGENTFDNLARLGLRSVVVDGDVFSLPLRDGTLEAVEAHRCRTPRGTKRNVVNGILLDDKRKRLEYWFTKQDVAIHKTVTLVSEITPFSARDANGHRNVLHLYNPSRFSQTRGITAMAPIANMVGMYDDLQFTHLVKAQASACFAIIREREIEYKGGGVETVGVQTTEIQSDGTVRTLESIAPGMDIAGAPGEKIHGFSPNVPNAEFFAHSNLILSIIAVNLGLPVAVLLLDPSNTNFSGWRGAIDQAREGFKNIRRWMISKFYRPVYMWQVRRWIAEDPAIRRAAGRDSVRVFSHEWSPPFWAYIEPLKDATGDRVSVEAGLNSRRGVLTRRGLDIEKIQKEMVDDAGDLVILAIEKAKEINTKNPEAGVEWRELLPQRAITAQVQGDTTKDDNK